MNLFAATFAFVRIASTAVAVLIGHISSNQLPSPTSCHPRQQQCLLKSKPLASAFGNGVIRGLILIVRGGRASSLSEELPRDRLRDRLPSRQSLLHPDLQGRERRRYYRAHNDMTLRPFATENIY